MAKAQTNTSKLGAATLYPSGDNWRFLIRWSILTITGMEEVGPVKAISLQSVITLTGVTRAEVAGEVGVGTLAALIPSCNSSNLRPRRYRTMVKWTTFPVSFRISTASWLLRPLKEVPLTSVIWSLTMILPDKSAILPSITLLTKIPHRSSENNPNMTEMDVHWLAKTWIYLTQYVCTERIFDSRPFMYNIFFWKKLLYKLHSLSGADRSGQVFEDISIIANHFRTFAWALHRMNRYASLPTVKVS